MKPTLKFPNPINKQDCELPKHLPMLSVEKQNKKGMNTNRRSFIYKVIRRFCSQEPDFSGHRSTVRSSPPLFLLSSWSHQISMLSVFLPGWLGGQTSHMYPVMPWHLINHPGQLFGDPLERKAGTKKRGGIKWGCLVCMRDGRQCIKRWQLSHSSLNKSSETLARCA